ncbi:MAG: hypothetical protein HYY05_07950 [Chloroflexi bacterium]|nr:hypothetical protein [Chloroflexota bacterium]
MRAGASLALLALLLPLAPASVTQAADPVKLRVELNDGGFNGNPGDFTIEVEQGALVELTFVWAHRALLANEHIIVLEGYKLEWDKLNFQQREASVQFIADKPGTFTFKCDLDCDIHEHLQKGHLKVKRSGEGSAAALTPTTLALSPSAWETGGEPVLLTVALQDAQGAPVSKAEIRFFLDAEFAGIQGKMDLGTAKTGADGTASLKFRPTLAEAQQSITARFEGVGLYDESQQAIEIQVVKEPPPAYVMAPVGLERRLPPGPQVLFFSVAPSNPLAPALAWGLDHVAPLTLATVLLAIWSTFGFVLYQTLGIRRAARDSSGR